jgi:hypothetical protein
VAAGEADELPASIILEARAELLERRRLPAGGKHVHAIYPTLRLVLPSSACDIASSLRYTLDDTIRRCGWLDLAEAQTRPGKESLIVGVGAFLACAGDGRAENSVQADEAALSFAVELIAVEVHDDAEIERAVNDAEASTAATVTVEGTSESRRARQRPSE